ncbi:MAG: AraC family transcriptional regulator [Rubrivivax sp.]|nr:AraC family transcriptional regulator [Rubrivivax sp.]
MDGLPNLAQAAAGGVVTRPVRPNGAGYVQRINGAIDHVVRHLGEPLRLQDVARAAHFSPFHFHRIFHSLVGETVHDFVKRLRLERALTVMAQQRDAAAVARAAGHARPPRRTLTQIALECGFTSSADFSRSFRARFGAAPTRFDLARWQRERRARMQAELVPGEGHRLAGLPPGENPDGFQVRLQRVPARRVAYLRVLRPYEGRGVAEAALRLVRWARARGLEGGQWLGYQWENPDVVELEHCRYDVGLVVPHATVVDGEVNVAEFAPMTLAELDIAGPIELEMRALDWLFRTWLPASGFVPDDQPCFEAWNGLPFAHGFQHFELRAQLPVVPA